jgi:hypothetical protein
LKAQLLAMCVILIMVSACEETMATDAGKVVGGGAALPLAGSESAADDGNAHNKDKGRYGLNTPGAGVQWKDENQKSHRQSYLVQLYDSLYKARNYYLRVDPCKSAAQTTMFLEVAEKCIKDCPAGILEVAGYSRRIMCKASWLKELNTKRCKFLDSTQPDPSKSPDKNTQPNTSDGPDTEKRQQPDG